MKSQSGDLERAMAQVHAQFAAMPPEQRRQMEAMMASRGVTLGAQGVSARSCLTKEQAARPAEPRLNADCTRQNVTRRGNTISFTFECTKPQPTTGEGEMTFVDDKAYTGHATLSTQVRGQPRQMTMQMRGKWLAADCGATPPAPTPPR
jgi:hypothetical protein